MTKVTGPLDVAETLQKKGLLIESIEHLILDGAAVHLWDKCSMLKAGFSRCG